MKAATIRPCATARHARFQSTPPVKAATSSTAFHRHAQAISIHAAREGGDRAAESAFKFLAISIHAAREGGDGKPSLFVARVYISIHAAREGGDLVSVAVSVPVFRFQSTPPVKAATLSLSKSTAGAAFQSTPPVKAATRQICVIACDLGISIHAAREGGDTNARLIKRYNIYFNPRRP